jgi:hypothetical protein
MGMPGLLNPLISAGLVKLYTELLPPNQGQGIVKLPWSGAPFNSKDNFVKLVNEKPTMEKNNFTTGKPRIVPNSEWELSGPYYKVE